MADKDGKTEKPTAKKLRDARKEGQFARTPDAATWMGVAGAAALAVAAALAGLAGALSFGVFFVVLMQRLRQAREGGKPGAALN